MNNGWQPMETAPKDGTKILLWDPAGWCCLGHYSCAGGSFWAGYRVPATAWQPLPGPPDGGTDV